MHALHLLLLALLLLAAGVAARSIYRELAYLILGKLLHRPQAQWKYHQGKVKPWLAPGLLAIIVALSGVEYLQKSRVDWITEAFKTFEALLSQTKALVDTEGADAVDSVSEWWRYDDKGYVIRVYDGDTILFKPENGREYKVRLYGVDTPERGQPHYRQAQMALATKIGKKKVSLDIRNKDSYGRTVATVYLDDKNINLSMVCEGYAWWYWRYAILEFEMARCEADAHSAKLGLWQSADPEPPWKFRRRK